ncbi:sugar phosphate isomerase/epimerase family protein [Rhodopirellula baltica]|uniref:Xylose isomerase domain-containing protein n=1 Tax=Rhodopirellula baltica SWK14 TaxID=993516 RepID=L7CCS5_RHOBT|nr:sugar phosphate isomerase/epimerase family protein [Rhodopirellula baltica]ELP31818.1 xylose isomerase domain-containing protein [Rhodopirellula baltica SWK14]
MKTPLIHRRTALQLTATSAMAAWLAQPLNLLAQEAEKTAAKGGQPLPYMDRIGLQLYTLRDAMKADPEGTLKAVAEAGYRQVELMNIDDEAVRLAAIARDNGLIVHSAFMDFNVIAEPEKDGVGSVETTLELAERIGLRHVVFGYIAKHQRDTADKCRAIADRANKAADQTRNAGMRMCYHNHSFEFATFNGGAAEEVNPEANSNEDEKKANKLTAFDIFVERFDPHKMEFELDVFWAKIGGRDPIEMMRRLAGRISQVHLKDLKKDTPVITDEGQVPNDAFKELGNGIIDIPAVMNLAREIGVDQCHVEQDQSPAPLDSVRESYAFLKGAPA